MHPVQHFRANFTNNEVTDTASNSLTSYAVGNVELYDTESQVRNLCLVWEDGRRAFYNYAYLVSVDLVLTDNLNVMMLYFSGQIVTLKGYQLSLLFDLLVNHAPKTITADNSRYYSPDQVERSFITEILTKNE
ncbi:hypothetical protein IC229_29580 [Spirosoma sp. BT702]|uniref:Uncharacterized protein n=1 Tax=Spirosoma profusum TaxID=2771354 RepID=A0A927AUU5_9BACT|nr:hypothetical protein [Spirosoma profusum]MBD2704819.1 hypothetical protein [Spirosoma profusum]